MEHERNLREKTFYSERGHLFSCFCIDCGCLHPILAYLRGSEWVDGLLFHELVVLL